MSWENISEEEFIQKATNVLEEAQRHNDYGQDKFQIMLLN